MYSIIVPTMWRIPTFPNFLHFLENLDLVSEILIIDNYPEKKPKDVVNSDKIKIIPQKINIGVNPAWNLGVDLAKQEKLCIMNDDLQFDVGVFGFLKDKLDINSGMIGIDIEHKPKPMGLEVVETLPFGFACTFFINKKNYIKIPDILKIFYGDNWLFFTNRHFGRVNKKIVGIEATGLISATCVDFMQVSYSDRHYYDIEFKKFLEKNKN